MTPERKAEIEQDLRILRAAQDRAYYHMRQTSCPGENCAVTGLLAAWVACVEECLKQEIDYVDSRNLLHTPPELAGYIGEKLSRVFGGVVLWNRSDGGHLAHIAFLTQGQIMLPDHVRNAIYIVETAIREAANEKRPDEQQLLLKGALYQLDTLRKSFTPVEPARPAPAEPELTTAMLDRASLALKGFGVGGEGWTETHYRTLAKEVLLAGIAAQKETEP